MKVVNKPLMVINGHLFMHKSLACENAWNFLLKSTAPASASAPATNATPATPTSVFIHSNTSLQQHTPQVGVMVQESNPRMLIMRFIFRVRFMQQI